MALGGSEDPPLGPRLLRSIVFVVYLPKPPQLRAVTRLRRLGSNTAANLLSIPGSQFNRENPIVFPGPHFLPNRYRQ